MASRFLGGRDVKKDSITKEVLGVGMGGGGWEEGVDVLMVMPFCGTV
jgi:hypothetical protein